MSRVSDLVQRIYEHRDIGLVVTRVLLSPATRAELAASEPVAELIGIICDPWDSDCDLIEARASGRAAGWPGRTPCHDETVTAAWDAMEQWLWADSLSNWNDAPGRTAAEVIDAFRRAADELEGA